MLLTRAAVRIRAFNTYPRPQRCAWCKRPITNEFAVHEWLVKRSGTRMKSYTPDGTQVHDLIMMPQNQVLMHHSCHDTHGQTFRAKLLSLEEAIHFQDVASIGQWYVDLWQKHKLSVPVGDFNEDLIPLNRLQWYDYLLTVI